ncbi:MAG: hypothetical protein AB1429_03250 [Pseudomonadota bacterium]|jgi:hypothetical protein
MIRTLLVSSLAAAALAAPAGFTVKAEDHAPFAQVQPVGDYRYDSGFHGYEARGYESPYPSRADPERYAGGYGDSAYGDGGYPYGPDGGYTYDNERAYADEDRYGGDHDRGYSYYRGYGEDGGRGAAQVRLAAWIQRGQSEGWLTRSEAYRCWINLHATDAYAQRLAYQYGGAPPYWAREQVEERYERLAVWLRTLHHSYRNGWTWDPE